VGQTIASRLVEVGHEVRMASRAAGNEKAKAWVAAAGAKVSEGTFSEAAGFWPAALQLHERHGFAGSTAGCRGGEHARLDSHRRVNPARHASARAAVGGFLKEWFGWRKVLDFGDVSAARALETYLPLWLRLMVTLGTPLFNVHFQRG
jgi:predicted dinucleotide-binding enzyme